jgi:hypothetical protein
MKKLKHPIRAIREPFGTAGLIVAMIALVAALGGTALAAAKLNSTQKKEVEKIAKKFAGKPGAPGTNGSPGAKGDTGAAGVNGTSGAPGAAGKSVTVTQIAEGNPTECEERGGALVKAEGAGTGVPVCTGEEGAVGSPWTAGGTLPVGSTETGAWSFGQAPEGIAFERVPISFTIPLAALLDEEHVHFIKEGATPPAECPGTVAAPKAASGNLCVYTGGESGAGNARVIHRLDEPEEVGASTAGAFVLVGAVTKLAFGVGSWAVTG